MSDNRKRIIAGLAAAAGAVGAYYGMRALMDRMQQRALNRQYYSRYLNRLRAAQEARDLETRRDTDTPVEGTRYPPHTQPDRQPIPSTGLPVMAETAPAFIAQPVTANDLAGPLAQYLIAFHDMIHQLRMRRWSGQPDAGKLLEKHSLMPEDRLHIQEELDRLADQTPELSDGDLPDGTLEQRMFNLLVKVRAALQNQDHSDDDLFRIGGEVRSQACQVLNEVLVPGQEVMEARRLYECG